MYPEVANIIEKEISKNNNLNYKKTLDKFFHMVWGKNNLSKELQKKIINVKLFQVHFKRNRLKNI